MTDDLAHLIKRAYPSGTTDCLDDAAIKNEPRDVRLRDVLQTVAAACDLSWDIEPGKLAYSVRFTEKHHPAFQQWVCHMDNAEKLSWIKAHGAPYPVLWLQISRVADYYDHFFNHWTPRGDTGYLDADFRQPPNAAWTARLALLKEQLEQAGFKYLTDELAAEKTPFVLERDYDSIPDDDPRWEDDNFEPPWVPSTVHECIFSH